MTTDDIQKLLASIPDLPLIAERAQGGRVEVLMNDHGDGRHVATVNDLRGNYSGLLVQAVPMLRWLLAEIDCMISNESLLATAHRDLVASSIIDAVLLERAQENVVSLRAEVQRLRAERKAMQEGSQ